MGIVRLGPPTELIIQLINMFHIDTFIETGTYKGGTTIWASQHFKNVTTIENSRTLFDSTSQKYKSIPNIKFLFGDSRTLLKTVIFNQQTPSILWLDSHWCGEESFGQDDQCSLLDELVILNQTQIDHFIFIDDARLFLSPPPLPNVIEYWPAIPDVLELLTRGFYERYIVISEDVIIAVPIQAKTLISTWCQDVSSKEWKHYGLQISQAKLSQMQRGIKQIQSGAMLMLGSMYQGFQHLISKIGK